MMWFPPSSTLQTFYFPRRSLSRLLSMSDLICSVHTPETQTLSTPSMSLESGKEDYVEEDSIEGESESGMF